MLVRRLAGLAGAGVSAWMLWETITPIMRQISLGSDLATELLNPPVSLLRVVSTSILIIGGLLALAPFAARSGCFQLARSSLR